MTEDNVGCEKPEHLTNGKTIHTKPVFIGGSAVNNDYGTILSTDRMWAIGNVSEALLGGSCFMLPASNKSGNWWNSHNSGEYFNFTADTAGTVYVLSGNSIANAEYSNWTKGSNTADPPDDKSWVTVAKDWNEYGAKYFACVIEHQDNYSRAVNPGIAENTGDDTMLYPLRMGNYAFKKFDAGEKVSIYHTGQKGQNAAKSIVIIIWDKPSEPDPTEPDPSEPDPTEPDPIEPDPAEPDPTEPEPIEDEDKVMSLVFDNTTDITKNVWSDISGHGNNVTLQIDVNNNWTENGFMVTNGSTNSTVLPNAVRDVINTNVFTLQFELSELNTVNNKNCGIFSSANGDFEIYINARGNVYFKWAGNTSAITMPKITAEQAVGHINTIVVDKDATTADNQIKWYVDGELIAYKKMNSEKAADEIRLVSQNSAYQGNVVFKSLTVYKKALSADEIAGGSE